MRVGICMKNAATYKQAEYDLLDTARLTHCKVMSETHPNDIQNLINKDMDVVMRLRDDRFGGSLGHGYGWHPTPLDFSIRALEVINRNPNVTKFQIHNEPNHPYYYEGWGKDDRHIQSFVTWYREVVSRIRDDAVRELELIFPGLAIPHNDISWLEGCEAAIMDSDGLGVHCYWQNNWSAMGWNNNHLSEQWGLNYRHYHNKYPGLPLYALEVGNSNGQRRGTPLEHQYPLNLDRQGQEFTEWIRQAKIDGMLEACAFFIMASNDLGWENDGFVWIKSSGEVLPQAFIVGKR